MRKYFYMIGFFVSYPFIMNAQELSYQIEKTHVDCCGNSTGKIELIGVTVGKSGDLSFRLTDADGKTLSESANAIFESLSAGAYKIQIYVDNDYYSETDAIVIEQPERLEISSFSSVSATCRIPADGTATVNVLGGVAPYTFVWNDVETAATPNTSYTFTNLDKGSYRVRIKDFNGCETEDTDIVVGVTPNPSLFAEQSQLERCDGNHTGKITVVATPADGGSNEFRFKLGEDGDFQDSPDGYAVFAGLTEDKYTVVVMDGNHCESQIEIVPVRASLPKLTATGSTIQCFNGTGTIHAEGVPDDDYGTTVYIKDYQLFWEDGTPAGNPKSSGTFYNVSPGNYRVRVKDMYGCENRVSVSVDGPEAQLDIKQESVGKPFGNTKGSITIRLSGGWEGYTVTFQRIVGNVDQEINKFYDLNAGNYTYNDLDAGRYRFILEEDRKGCGIRINQEGGIPIPALTIDLDYATGEPELNVSDLKVYPNPSGNGLFAIEWENHEVRGVTLEVFNMSGRLVYKTNAQTESRTMLDVSALGQGTYLLRIPELNIRQIIVFL